MTKTKRLAKARFAVYAKKAAEFERAMRDAVTRQDWNAVGLIAVQAVISAADALTTFYLGERSSGDAHGDVTSLLRQLPLAGAGERSKQVADVLAAKNVIEYEDTDFDEAAARRVEKQARRFLAWARENLRP